MSHWEHRKIDLSYAPRRGDLIDLLNDAGKEGWELVALTPNAMAYMKRSAEHVYMLERRTAPAQRVPNGETDLGWTRDRPTGSRQSESRRRRN